MSSLDYEMKSVKGYLQFSALINSILFLLFIFVDFNPLVNGEHGKTSSALFFSSFHGLWFYLESGILLMGASYMGLFLWERLSDTQRKGVWLFSGSILYLDFVVNFGSWETTILPASVYIGLFLFWISLNLIYEGGRWFWFFSLGAVTSFVVQFFLFNVREFMLFYFVRGIYYDRLEYLNLVKTGIEILWFWGLVFRWYLARTFRGIPVNLEKKKTYSPYDPLYPYGK